MKKIGFAILSAIIGLAGYSQSIPVTFVKKSAALDGSFRPQDSLNILDAQIVNIANFSSVVGATVVWEGLDGRLNATEVFEEIGDSTSTDASVSFTISNVDTIVAIKVNGVSICDTIKSAPTADSLATLVSDSLGALAAFTSTSTGAVVTVTEDTSSDSRNGQIVKIIYADDSISVSFTGGRIGHSVETRLNYSIDGAAQSPKVVLLTEGGVSKYFAIARMGNIIGTSAGGSLIKYDAIRSREINVSEGANQVRNKIIAR